MDVTATSKDDALQARGERAWKEHAAQQPSDPVHFLSTQVRVPLQSHDHEQEPLAASVLSQAAFSRSSAALETTTTMMMMIMMMIRRGMPMQRAQQIPQAQRPALAAFFPSSLDDFPIFSFL